MSEGVAESRFYMWRAVFAMAGADGFLALEEQDMLYKHLDKVPFSEDQKRILQEDLASPQDVEEMFMKIETDADKRYFFELARALAWCDGNLDDQEEKILDHLKEVSGVEDVLKNLQQTREPGLLKGLNDALKTDGFPGIVKYLGGEA